MDIDIHIIGIDDIAIDHDRNRTCDSLHAVLRKLMIGHGVQSLPAAAAIFVLIGFRLMMFGFCDHWEYNQEQLRGAADFHLGNVLTQPQTLSPNPLTSNEPKIPQNPENPNRLII